MFERIIRRLSEITVMVVAGDRKGLSRAIQDRLDLVASISGEANSDNLTAFSAWLSTIGSRG